MSICGTAARYHGRGGTSRGNLVVLLQREGGGQETCGRIGTTGAREVVEGGPDKGFARGGVSARPPPPKHTHTGLQQ